jgi:signal transduction histidine kinase
MSQEPAVFDAPLRRAAEPPPRVTQGADRHARESDLIAELAAVMGAVDAGILTVDGQGRVRSQNDIAVGILGGRLTELADALGSFARRGPDLPIPSFDGTTRWRRERTELQLVHRPDRWLELTRYLDPRDASEAVVIRDVTEARHGRGLRDAFLGMLSHELRTPVTSIYAASDLLRRSTTTFDERERAGLIDDIAAEAERLLRLVDDLLVLAHFDEGLELIKEPSLLQRVVPAVVERERRRWPGVGIELRIGPDLPVVSGDETSVEQVVRNLISNAAKYGAGSPVIVDLRASDQERGAVVRVLDRGHGVDPEEADSLFRPFFRSPRTAAVSSGAGVGLYVCRRLVEAMGGHMWAGPRDGGGSEFAFWLPEYSHDAEEPDARGLSAQESSAGERSAREDAAPTTDDATPSTPSAAPPVTSLDTAPARTELAPAGYRDAQGMPPGTT